jgi:hypothetical protein
MYWIIGIAAVIIIGVAIYFLTKKKDNGAVVEQPPIEQPPIGYPLDWEDAAYLFHFKDMKPPLAGSEYESKPYQHWLEWGKAAGWKWKPNGWSSEWYLKNNPDVAASSVYKTQPLLHYWQWGMQEGRSYLDPSISWAPTQKGLHLILDTQDKHEYFSAMRIENGLLLGSYGLHDGGARIYFFDGKTLTLELQTDRESIFDMFMPDDGLPLATSEHNASIYKRTATGEWELKYSRSRYEDLMFYIRKTDDGTLWANWNGYDNNMSGLIKSNDNGNTWQDSTQFPGWWLCGMCVDGNDVFLSGSKDNSNVIVDKTGKVIESCINDSNYVNWGICKKDGILNYGTWNDTNKADGSYINVNNGSVSMQVADQKPPFVQAIAIKNGVRYAIATWDWNDAANSTLVLQSPDGYNWSILTTIPCAHIMNMYFADDGMYLMGGRNRYFGKVYFYKF